MRILGGNSLKKIGKDGPPSEFVVLFFCVATIVEIYCEGSEGGRGGIFLLFSFLSTRGRDGQHTPAAVVQ